MPKVITYGGDTKIGAYKFSDRKKVCLCIEKGNTLVIYGTFNNENAASDFMDELGKFLGAEFENPTEKVCTGKRCPMQVGYDVSKCKDKECIYRTETEKGGVE